MLQSTNTNMAKYFKDTIHM